MAEKYGNGNNYKGNSSPKAFEYTQRTAGERKTLTIKLGTKSGKATMYISQDGMKILNDAGIYLKVEDIK